MATTDPHPHRDPRRDALVTFLWMVAVLVVMDLALGAVLGMPDDPRTPPSRLAMYLDFGTSLTGKLRRLAGPSDSLAAPVAHAGWLDPASWPAPAPVAAGKRRIAVYGQSFTYAIMDTLAAHDSSVVLRPLGGPSAPPGHLYALWREDRRRTPAAVRVLGVLASSVRGMDATTGATWMFESPYPYVYPHWRIVGDSLVGAAPVFTSLAGLRQTLADPVQLGAWRARLAADDAWFEPVLFDANAADHSVILRLLRRAWAQRQQREHLARVHGPKGFASGEQLRVLGALLLDFARTTRADGETPVILLLEDQGYDDHLVRALGPGLRAAGVAYIGSEQIAPAGDPRNFMPDGHFVGTANQRLAAAVDSLVHASDGLAR